MFNNSRIVHGSKSMFWRCAYSTTLLDSDIVTIRSSGTENIHDCQGTTKHLYTLHIGRSCPNGHTKSILDAHNTSRGHQEHSEKSTKKRYVFAADGIFKIELIIF